MSVIEDVEAILRTAADADASDVHLSVGATPRMRVRGKLAEMDFPRLSPADTLDILVNLMNDVQRERFEEKGEFDMACSFAGNIRCRVSAYKQMGNVSLAFRLISPHVPSLESLSAPEAVAGLCAERSGLVLVAGPVGSGKTTTLAAIADHINKNREAHIITLERPVEYLHIHDKSVVDQREIGLDSESYAMALRAALREDPDVILAGELEDADTVCAALDAVEAGCLVFTAVAVTGANGALEYLLHKFPAALQQQIRNRLAGVLQAVVVQRRSPENHGISYEVLQVTAQNRAELRGVRTGKV